MANLSVCPSVTRKYCIEMNAHIVKFGTVSQMERSVFLRGQLCPHPSVPQIFGTRI